MANWKKTRQLEYTMVSFPVESRELLVELCDLNGKTGPFDLCRTVLHKDASKHVGGPSAEDFRMLRSGSNSCKDNETFWFASQTGAANVASNHTDFA